MKLRGEYDFPPETVLVLMCLNPHPLSFFYSQAFCCLRVNLNNRFRHSFSAGRQIQAEPVVDLQCPAVREDEGVSVQYIRRGILLLVVGEGMISVLFQFGRPDFTFPCRRIDARFAVRPQEPFLILFLNERDRENSELLQFGECDSCLLQPEIEEIFWGLDLTPQKGEALPSC